MFATCIFCTRPLGANEAIEAFPVGRRLAFDAAKGRLWVVCPNCDRWNLTPVEERWEAIEAAERLYRDSNRRVATDNIGLARLPDGLDLVRIGKPLRPEMAAWRYGDQFGRRRRRALIGTTAAVGAAGVVAVATLPFSSFLAGMAAGAAGVGAFAGALNSGNWRKNFGTRWIPDGEQQYFLVQQADLANARLRGTTNSSGAKDAGAWSLVVPYRRREPIPRMKLSDSLNLPSVGEVTLRGPSALEAARRMLPLINGWGARPARVQEAVRALEDWGGPERAFAQAAANVRAYSMQQAFGDTGAIQFFPQPVRLALEMAAHEEQERRALEGELAELARVWEEAEAIAAISDDMLLPQGVWSRFERIRARLRPGGE